MRNLGFSWETLVAEAAAASVISASGLRDLPSLPWSLYELALKTILQVAKERGY